MILTAKTSSQQSSAIGFATEVELVKTFTKLLASQKMHVALEFDCGFGIADVVFFEQRHHDKQKVQSLGLIDPDWAYALKILPYRKNFTLEYLMEISGSSRTVAKKALDTFINAGYCILKPNKYYEKIRQPQVVASQLTAIEAKLSNWRKAMWQASRYKAFADYAYVLLDQKNARPAIKNIQEFERFNIGLLIFSVAGNLEVILHPKKEKTTLDTLYWKAHAKLARNL